jgi:predicted transcriptional regulator
MHRTTIVLPDDLDRRLSDAARRHQSSRTEILRQALSAFLESEARPRPRSVGLGRRATPLVTSENVKDSVRAEWRDSKREKPRA